MEGGYGCWDSQTAHTHVNTKFAFLFIQFQCTLRSYGLMELGIEGRVFTTMQNGFGQRVAQCTEIIRVSNSFIGFSNACLCCMEKRQD